MNILARSRSVQTEVGRAVVAVRAANEGPVSCEADVEPRLSPTGFDPSLQNTFRSVGINLARSFGQPDHDLK